MGTIVEPSPEFVASGEVTTVRDIVGRTHLDVNRVIGVFNAVLSRGASRSKVNDYNVWELDTSYTLTADGLKSAIKDRNSVVRWHERVFEENGFSRKDAHDFMRASVEEMGAVFRPRTELTGCIGSPYEGARSDLEDRGFTVSRVPYLGYSTGSTYGDPFPYPETIIDYDAGGFEPGDFVPLNETHDNRAIELSVFDSLTQSQVPLGMFPGDTYSWSGYIMNYLARYSIGVRTITIVSTDVNGEYATMPDGTVANLDGGGYFPEDMVWAGVLGGVPPYPGCFVDIVVYGKGIPQIVGLQTGAAETALTNAGWPAGTLLEMTSIAAGAACVDSSRESGDIIAQYPWGHGLPGLTKVLVVTLD